MGNFDKKLGLARPPSPLVGTKSQVYPKKVWTAPLRKVPSFIEIPYFLNSLPKGGHVLHCLWEFFSLKIIEGEVDPPDEGEDPCSGHPGKGDLSANSDRQAQAQIEVRGWSAFLPDSLKASEV